jgi:ElaB/YqjD/DUF883 family membrane-anchored ribosome-binding protein
MPSNSGSSGESMTDRGAFKHDDLAEQAAQAKDRVSDAIRDTSDTVGEVGAELSERVSQMKDRVSSIARTAADTVDGRRATTADGLEAAASTLRDRAARLPGGDKVSEVAHAAADRLSTTADYVRTHDVNRMKTDVKTLVKNNPGPSLLVAAALGFLLGRAMTRD